MCKQKIYISGPMTGYPDLNFPAFFEAEEIINGLGPDYGAVNPARLNEDVKGDWNACLRRDIKYVCDCDGILLLDGWESSKGAQLEFHVAKALGLDVYVFTKSIGKLNV
jgi:hypothetical protein